MAAIATGIGDAGSGESLGRDISSELGSVLGDAYDSATGEESPGGEGGSPESLPTETQFETPGGEAPTPQSQQRTTQQAQTSPQSQQSQQNQPTEQAQSPWPLSADGKAYNVPTAELPRLQSALQFQQQVGQIFSSPVEAQSAASQAFDLRSMTNDWVYGTDDAVSSVLNHWAGANSDPSQRAAYQRSFERMVTMAPSILQKMNPQAYQTFVSSQGKALVQSMYDKAAQTGNPEHLMEAQYVEWGLTGKYQDKAVAADPQVQARTQFEQQQREFDQRQDAAMRRDVGNFSNTAVEGPKFQQLNTAIDKYLAPVKDRFNEVAYQDLRSGIQRELMDSLMKQDWFTEHKQNFDQLMSDFRTSWQSGVPGKGLQPRVQAYLQDFMSRANRALPSIAAKRVNATTQARAGAPNGRPSAPQQRGADRSSAQQPATPANGQSKRLTSDEWDNQFAAAFK
jgi:hypothetical protein